MSATDRLDEIEARANAAEVAGRFESDYPTWEAYEAAQDSCADVPALVAALRAVLATHQPIRHCPSDKHETATCPCGVRLCAQCAHHYPCPTVRAITEALA